MLQCGRGEDVSMPDGGEEQKGEKEPKGGMSSRVQDVNVSRNGKHEVTRSSPRHSFRFSMHLV